MPPSIHPYTACSDEEAPGTGGTAPARTLLFAPKNARPFR